MDMTFTLTNGTEKELGKWLIFLMIKAIYTILMFKKTRFVVRGTILDFQSLIKEIPNKWKI